MRHTGSLWLGRAVLVLMTCVIWPNQAVQGQGIVSPGSGAMHRSMGGASTAKGADALGALFWNPAAISGLPRNEVVIGSEMILPDIHLASTVPAGAFGILGPATTQSGTTRSQSGLAPTTGVGFVYRGEDSKLSFGMGIFTLAAGGVNYPGDPSNPVLAPVGPLGQFILGPQAASALILAIEPTVAFQLTEQIAIGIGPMVDVALVGFDPAFFGPPSAPTTPLPPPFGPAASFPSGTHTRPFWGGGFRAGLTFKIMDNLVAGFSYMSPQWFETWRFNARDADGNPIRFETGFTLPAIYSLGLGFDGIEGLLLVADVRWFEYRTTQLLGEPPSQAGAGWESIWAVALGARYMLSERLSVQLGYIFNENPVPADFALLNTQLPLINMHTASVGAYLQMNDWIGLSMAYVHGFENSITGSVFPLLGTSTTIDSKYDSFVLGIHIKFGPEENKDQ